MLKSLLSLVRAHNYQVALNFSGIGIILKHIKIVLGTASRLKFSLAVQKLGR